MIRNTYIVEDIQDCIVEYLQALQVSAPWNRWTIIYGYPNEEKFNLEEVLIYVQPPKFQSGEIKNQGSQIGLGQWMMRLGVWNDRLAGGAEEIGIAESQILYSFRHKGRMADTTFDVTNSAAYTGTTLLAQGIQIDRIEGPTEVLKNVDTNEFRSEFDIFLKG